MFPARCCVFILLYHTFCSFAKPAYSVPQREQSRSSRQSAAQAGSAGNASSVCGGNGFVLLYSGLFPNSEYYTKHPIRHHQFSCGLSDLSPQSLLCACLAANDVVLIILWILAAKENTGYLCVVICFVMFLINDLYGFLNWRRMEKRQLKME